jgi:mRNA interferase MazF
MLRELVLASMDKTRPVLILTRDGMRPLLTNVTVAPITSTIRGLLTEVPVGPRNGLDHDGVASLDNITTIPVVNLGRHVGFLLPDQEPALARAIASAFQLDPWWDHFDASTGRPDAH